MDFVDVDGLIVVIAACSTPATVGELIFCAIGNDRSCVGTKLGTATEGVTAIAIRILFKCVHTVFITLTGFCFRPKEFKHTRSGRCHLNRCPVIKITDKLYDERIGCIHTEYDTLLAVADGCVSAKVIVSVKAGSLKKF